MAVYNEILVGRVNRFLQKLLGMKGGPPAPSLAGDVVTVLPLFVGVESFLHQGWEKFGVAQLLLGTVGNFSKVQFRNPAGSNVIAVIEKLDLVAGVNSADLQVRIQSPAAADFGGLFTGKLGLDNRGRSLPTCVVSSQNSDANFITGTIIFEVSTNAQVLVPVIRGQGQQIAILPDTSLEIAQNTTNQLLSFSIWWRERFLEETERT